MPFAIRSFHPSDLYALYRICLETGDSGADATALYRDPELLGHYYAAPYAIHEPDLCLVLTHNGVPCGYILGTRDSAAFAEWMDTAWLPVLRTRYPLPAPGDMSPDAEMIRRFHARPARHPALAAYPAHLHIDLLPSAQGQGVGHRLMDAFLGRLRALGVPAVHLGVGMRNTRGIRFYERAGFTRIVEAPDWIGFGRTVGTH